MSKIIKAANASLRRLRKAAFMLAEERADTLNAAIDYAILIDEAGYDGIEWLNAWRHGDISAMSALDAWRKSNGMTL